MLMHIKMINWILDVAKGNVEEAEKYVKLAHRMKHENRAAADWCIEMAKRHLDFDERGDMMIDQMCRELGEAAGNSELLAAMKTHVHERRAWLAEETAEVRTMIEMFSK